MVVVPAGCVVEVVRGAVVGDVPELADGGRVVLVVDVGELSGSLPDVVEVARSGSGWGSTAGCIGTAVGSGESAATTAIVVGITVTG